MNVEKNIAARSEVGIELKYEFVKAKERRDDGNDDDDDEEMKVYFLIYIISALRTLSTPQTAAHRSEGSNFFWLFHLETF